MEMSALQILNQEKGVKNWKKKASDAQILISFPVFEQVLQLKKS
jgi:hypothetical protein